jgi:hypothetical protein
MWGGHRGDSCDDDSECGPGLACDYGSWFSSRSCQCTTEALCVDGASCGPKGCTWLHSVPLGKGCEHNANCVDDLICFWGNGLPYVCAPPSRPGERCGHDTDCIAGVTCDFSTRTCEHPEPRCTASAFRTRANMPPGMVILIWIAFVATRALRRGVEGKPKATGRTDQ